MQGIESEKDMPFMKIVNIYKARAALGTGQQIIFMELGVRRRNRNLVLQIIGEQTLNGDIRFRCLFR